ncbi:MAG: hypothetical protein WC495_01440 [Patescibacteria group bacterium]|jgi:uncharacterized YccA/Bax inhibitor family protein
MILGLDSKLALAILSTIVGVVGGFLPYFRDIFRKKTKPHAYTWLIWTITQGTAVAGLWYGKAGWGVLPLTIGTILVFAIFLLSLKLGTKNITKNDTAILVAALLAIFVWWQLHNPLLAVIMVSVIDVIGYVPSFRKTFQEPWTETPISWVMFALTNLISMLALAEYNFLTLTYLISITAANISLLAICLLRRRIVPDQTLIKNQ